MKIMTIVGARPEFIQTAPVTKAFRQRGYADVLVHTGQHYDFNMSDIFFADLDIPQPDVHLGVGSGSHAKQTGEMLLRLEQTMEREQPDCVVVFGDTNSTVAAALAAAKLCLPVAHIEAGLRSFDRTMPEEVNRVVTDHLSSVLFAPTQIAVSNLSREGVLSGVHQVGDVRVDLLHGLLEGAQQRAAHLLNRIGLPGSAHFALATIHRPVNTDHEQNLRNIVVGFGRLGLPVVLPVHPRLGKMLAKYDLQFANNVYQTDPLGYLDMIALLSACDFVLTDSGGLQKEAYMLRRPTVTIRTTTEWVETVESGWNRLSDTDPEAITAAVDAMLGSLPHDHPEYYGSIGVCQRICNVLQAEIPEKIH